MFTYHFLFRNTHTHAQKQKDAHRCLHSRTHIGLHTYTQQHFQKHSLGIQKHTIHSITHIHKHTHNDTQRFAHIYKHKQTLPPPPPSISPNTQTDEVQTKPCAEKKILKNCPNHEVMLLALCFSHTQIGCQQKKS